MPVFNVRPFVAEAITSVLSQSFADFELLIVDDGSSDGTDEVVRSFTDPRIRYIRYDKNRGLVAVLNDGLREARGRYIARMDGDDRMHAERLKRQLAVMEADPGVVVLASFVDIINTDGERTGTWSTDRATKSEEEIARMMPRTNCIAHPSVMMRNDVMKAFRYEGTHEDWDLWMRLLSRGHRIAKVPEVLLEQRAHTASYMGALKKRMPLEVRLWRSRSFFLRREGLRVLFNGFDHAVITAQMRTLARYVLNDLLKPFARDLKRVLTYSPFALMREKKTLERELAVWKGRHLFLFPYLGRGGAEQVHVNILHSVKQEDPLVMITGFSRDRGMAPAFQANANVLELPRALNHPFTRGSAGRRIAQHLNGLQHPVLFSSLTSTFYEVLPLLNKEVRTIWLQHAFLYQPDGNAQHRSWLPLEPRVDRYVFVSRQAMAEFDHFLFANNVPRDHRSKLRFISNAIAHAGQARAHERLGLLFVGRDSAEKRLALFLSIAAELQREQPERYRFTVVGPSNRNNIPGVTFTGPIDDQERLTDLYAQHDILLLTSSREGFPMVIMEAMAQGLAVVSTPVGDVPNRLDATCAVITSTTDASIVQGEMVKAITELDRDRDQLLRMKQAALAKARSEFGMEEFRKRYRELLLAEDPRA